MSKILVIRLFLSAFFFFAIFYGSWWMAPLFGLIILVKFVAVEVVIGAMIMDFLYSTHVGFYDFPAVWTTLSVILFFAFKFLHSKLF